jgi:hypothetical protein
LSIAEIPAQVIKCQLSEASILQQLLQDRVI